MLVSVRPVSKSEVAAMLLNLERAEINAREDMRSRLSALEQKLLFAAEEREESFPVVIFSRGEEDIPVRRINDRVFFSKERESFLFAKSGMDEAVSAFSFSNLARFCDVPEIREAFLRNPDFYKDIFGA